MSGRRMIIGFWLPLAMLTGCEERAPVAATQPATTRPVRMKGFIAFVGAGERHPLWPILRRGAQKYAQHLGAIEVRFLSPSGDSPREQMDLLRGLTDERMRGLCVQVLDPFALPGVLSEIQSRGVAIVPMVHEPRGLAWAGFAGLDHEAIGRELADATARILEGKGSIMLLHAGADHPVFGPRLSSFDAEIRRHPGVEVYARVDCRGDALQARQLMRERSERYPRLSAWVSLGEWPTTGLASEESLGLPASCRLIIFGGGPEQWPLIRSGRCPAVVAADYHEIGTRALQFCETAIRRPSQLESRYLAPVRAIEAGGLSAFIEEWHTWSDQPPAGGS